MNYFRQIWNHRSKILTPLSSMTSKQDKWNLIKECQKAFDTIKKQVSRKTLLFYSNFNELYGIHTDSSKLQLGSAISITDKTIAFNSRKLNANQVNYIIIDCA